MWSLTGWPVLIGAVVLCIVTPVATVMLWHRAGRSRWRWPLHTVTVLIAQLTAVLMAAVLLNDNFGFYSSWRELIGGEHHRITVAQVRTGSLDTLLAARTTAAAHSGHGTMARIIIPARAPGVGAHEAQVYLPPQYGAPQYLHRQFPVVELIAGAGGHPNTWQQHLQLARLLDRGIAAGTIIPFIAVMPTVMVAPPRDTECVNVAHGPQVESYLTTDVYTAVTHDFRAATTRDGWGLMGYSTGGYCASNILLRHPDSYVAGVSLAGYAKPYLDSTTGPLFGRDQTLKNENTPLWRVQHLTAPDVSLLLMTTHDDSATYHDALAMQHAARAPLNVCLLALRHGGHNFAVWSAQEPTAFGWLSRQLTPPLRPIPSVDGRSPSN